MKFADLYETVGKLEALPSRADSADERRRVELANAMVGDLVEEYRRLEDYERKYSPTLIDETEDAYALDVLRSIAQMFETWVADAQPVYDILKQLPSALQVIPRLHELRDGIGFSRARLVGKPEDVVEGVQQLRRGRGRRMTVEELRNELRAPRRA